MLPEELLLHVCKFLIEEDVIDFMSFSICSKEIINMFRQPHFLREIAHHIGVSHRQIISDTFLYGIHPQRLICREHQVFMDICQMPRYLFRVNSSKDFSRITYSVVPADHPLTGQFHVLAMPATSNTDGIYRYITAQPLSFRRARDLVEEKTRKEVSMAVESIKRVFFCDEIMGKVGQMWSIFPFLEHHEYEDNDIAMPDEHEMVRIQEQFQKDTEYVHDPEELREWIIAFIEAVYEHFREKNPEFTQEFINDVDEVFYDLVK